MTVKGRLRFIKHNPNPLFTQVFAKANDKQNKEYKKITNYCKKQTSLYKTQTQPAFYAGFCKS